MNPENVIISGAFHDLLGEFGIDPLDYYNEFRRASSTISPTMQFPDSLLYKSSVGFGQASIRSRSMYSLYWRILNTDRVFYDPNTFIRYCAEMRQSRNRLHKQCNSYDSVGIDHRYFPELLYFAVFNDVHYPSHTLRRIAVSSVLYSINHPNALPEMRSQYSDIHSTAANYLWKSTALTMNPFHALADVMLFTLCAYPHDTWRVVNYFMEIRRRIISIYQRNAANITTTLQNFSRFLHGDSNVLVYYQRPDPSRVMDVVRRNTNFFWF